MTKRVLATVAIVLLIPTVTIVTLDTVAPGWDLQLAWELRPFVPERVQRGILWWTGPLRLSDEELRKRGVTLINSSPSESESADPENE